MAKFLFTVWPYPGHMHPNLAVADALRDLGHEVAFYTGGSLRTSLENDGYHCFPFQRLDEAGVEAMVIALDEMSLQWWRARRKKSLLRDWLLGTAEQQLGDLADLHEVWRPDVLVCDPAMWGPLLVFQETAKIPLAVLSIIASCALPGPEGPIVGLPLPRPRGAIARSGRRVLRAVASLVAADVRRAAEALRARHGLAPVGTSVTEFSGRVPLYLVPSTPLYDGERSDLPSCVHYVGPCERSPRDDVSPPSWLTRMSRDRPVVYVTEGTMHSKPPLLLAAALAGLAPLPVRVVVTTGQHRDPADLGLDAIPTNARVERWVPHRDLLPRTDVVVTTGGAGTVLAALAAGIPLVIVPTAWDQPENAWRVAEAGAGIRLRASRCTPDRVRVAVERLLSEPSFRQNARRLADDFARYGGAAQAAALLADLAAGRGEFAPREQPGSAGRDIGGEIHLPATGTQRSPRTHDLERQH